MLCKVIYLVIYLLPFFLFSDNQVGSDNQVDKVSDNQIDKDWSSPLNFRPKQIKPTWRPQILTNHQNGNAERIFYYETYKEKKIPIKECFFYPNGQLYKEVELIELDTDDQNNIVPHGLYVSYYSSGLLQSLALYYKGNLHGKVYEYYPNNF